VSWTFLFSCVLRFWQITSKIGVFLPESPPKLKKKLYQVLAETSLMTAAWNHPEHRFYSLPEPLKGEKRAKRKVAKSKIEVV